jgi:hypothetical protein
MQGVGVRAWAIVVVEAGVWMGVARVVGGGGAGFGGEGVEAAFEEVPVGAGEGEVLGERFSLVMKGNYGEGEGSYSAEDSKAQLDVAPDCGPAVDPAEVGDGEA